MANTFGSITLEITELSIRGGELLMLEKDVICDTPFQVSTVLSGSGRKAQRVSISGICDKADLISFVDCYNEYSQATLKIDIEGTTAIDGLYMIGNFSYNYKIAESKAYYTAELIEIGYAEIPEEGS